MTRILAIDLGKFKSVACLYDAETAQVVFQTLRTTPQTVHDRQPLSTRAGAGTRSSSRPIEVTP